jgi:hypothetical protein
MDKLIKLLEEIRDLLKEDININNRNLILNESLVRTFQQYDAEIFEEDEIKRELQKRGSGYNKSKNKNILGSPGGQ